MASAFLPLLSYDDAGSEEAAVASTSAAPQQHAATATAAAALSSEHVPQPPRRTIAVPPASAGSRNEAGLDTGVLDSVLRRFRAVDLSGEPPNAAPARAANPTPAATKRPAAPGGSKPALKKKAVAPPTPEEAAKAAQLAAEATGRRIAAEATLRAKQERSSAALAAVEWMLEHTASSEAELRERALGPLTSAEFEEAMRERALTGVCGCPLCDAPLTRPTDLGKTRVLLRERKVYRSEAPLFCGDACAARARAIQVSLPEETPLPVYDAKQGMVVPVSAHAAPAAAAAPPPAPVAATGAAFGVGGVVTMAGSIVEHAAPQPDAGAQLLPDAALSPEARAAAAAAVEVFAPRAEPRRVRWADGVDAAPPQAASAEPPKSAGRPVAGVSTAVSYDMPERLSASYYQSKVERALSAARARGEQAAEEARDIMPPTVEQAVSEETAAAEAFVRGWAEALDKAADAPDVAGAARPQAGPPASSSAAAAAAAAAAPPSAASSGGATFVFDVLAEGSFGAGVRKDDDDPSQPRGAGLTNMGQFAYGELKLIREDDDGGRRPTRRQAEGSDDGEEEDEELDDDAFDEGDEVDEAADDVDVDEIEQPLGQEADADDDDGWAAERYGATGGEEGDYEDYDLEEEEAEDAPSAVKGAHPLFEPATPEMRPMLSPFLQIWTALDCWVTPATLAFLASAPDASPVAAPQMTPEEAAAASHRAPPLRPREAGEVMQALFSGLDRAMPTVCTELGLRVPVSAMDAALQALLRTFAFRGAAPALNAPRWALLLLLLLEPLGRTRLPQLGADLATERAHRGARALTEAAGFTTEQYATLREPLAWAQRE